MSYQVLARKWRPKTFREMVGQEHVLQAMINALDHDRLHHAYLFTGTRGVGKTTIARILSKCLNCESGVSSQPCGVCGSCLEVDEGRFVDLMEIDAASNTRVEDTREILENVQYAPTRGRYKVYLIDEVHMLSNHSFNALLKTLEEPPPHVKFLLATTDPQKLPATILSRCLQFSLKNMPPQRIVDHLTHVLNEEVISFETDALWELGRAADGSMRDAMSLTDQAIAYTGGKLEAEKVRMMLGTIDRGLVQRLVATLIESNVESVLQVVDELADHAPDYMSVLSELVSMLHRIAIAQALPAAVDDSYGDAHTIKDLAAKVTAEDVQLYYQIALQSLKDLPLSPDQRAGLEMTLLRMMLFRPGAGPGSPSGRKTPPASSPVAKTNSPNSGSSAGGLKPPAGRAALSSVRATLSGQKSPDETRPSRLADNDALSSPAVASRSMRTAGNAVAQAETAQAAVPMDPAPRLQEAPIAEIPLPDVSMSEAPEYGIPPMPDAFPHEYQTNAQNAAGERNDKNLAGYKVNDTALDHAERQKVVAIGDSHSTPNRSNDTQAGGRDLISPSELGADTRLKAPRLDDPYDDEWAEVVRRLDLVGGAMNLARNCSLVAVNASQYSLHLSPSHQALCNDQQIEKIRVALSSFKKDAELRVSIELQQPSQLTPLQLTEQRKVDRVKAAEQALLSDPFAVQMAQSFAAQLLSDSVCPIDGE